MEREMNLLEILQALWKRITILVLITLGFTLLGGVASFLLNEKVYTSSASVNVGEEKEKGTVVYNEISREPIHERVIHYGNATIVNKFNRFYTDSIKSCDLLEEVSQSLNLDISVENLSQSITIEVP